MMLETLLAIIALLIPTAALGLDWSSKKREEQRQKAMSVAESIRYRHEQEILSTQRISEWGQRVTRALSLADHIINCPLATRTEMHLDKDRLELAAELSALVDEGRWLFRNVSVGDFGREKASLNQGFRDHRLDSLVRTYKSLLQRDSIDPSADRKDFSFKIQELTIPLLAQLNRET